MILSLVIGLLVAIVLLFAAGVSYQTLGAYRDQRRFPPFGRIVSAAGCKFHLAEQGSGAPAVILEAGLAASSLSWARVVPLVAQFTRVVSYDRAGLGWSRACQPRGALSLEQLGGELAALLEKAAIPAPYVLVGHSFGALIVRTFAHARSNEVAGLVFVDPVSIRSWASCSAADQRRLALGARLSRRGAWLARLGVVRFALAAAARTPRVTASIAKASAGKATDFLGRLVGEVQKLPPEILPLARSHWARPQSFQTMAEYLEALPGCAQCASSLTVPAAIPLVVLSAATATREELQEREEWIQQSERGRHLYVENTGHWLHLDRPEAVAAAIQQLVSDIRHGTEAHSYRV